MPISKTEKELAAVAISIAAGCKPCTDFHMKAVRETGATRAQIRQAVQQAAAVRGAAGGIMLSYGLAHLGDAAEPPAAPAAANRQAVLTGLGAAFAVNCTSGLDHYIAAAGAMDVETGEIVEITKLARFIRGKGASHVDRRVEALGQDTQPAEACCDG